MKRFPSAERPGESIEAGPVVDCHQHLWTPAFLEALVARATPPRLLGQGEGDSWRLETSGEPPSTIDPAAHDATRRRQQDAEDGIDLTLLSLSAPLGIEYLPPGEAEPLLSAWHGAAEALTGDSPYRVWASPSLVEPDLAALARLLARESICGLQVPAPALATPGALERLAPVLAVVEAADKPVLIHPGAVSARRDEEPALPGWWPALIDYPAQQAAAWFAWHVAGRALLPRLRVCFVALAGLAPVHHERWQQRGGQLGAIDTGVFYETSSYGTRAIDALVRVVGVDACVHGSDRPYAKPTDPGLGDAFSRALFVTNPARLLRGARS